MRRHMQQPIELGATRSAEELLGQRVLINCKKTRATETLDKLFGEDILRAVPRSNLAMGVYDPRNSKLAKLRGKVFSSNEQNNWFQRKLCGGVQRACHLASGGKTALGIEAHSPELQYERDVRHALNKNTKLREFRRQ